MALEPKSVHAQVKHTHMQTCLRARLLRLTIVPQMGSAAVGSISSPSLARAEDANRKPPPQGKPWLPSSSGLRSSDGFSPLPSAHSAFRRPSCEALLPPHASRQRRQLPSKAARSSRCTAGTPHAHNFLSRGHQLRHWNGTP